jgi:hypothetical protein
VHLTPELAYLQKRIDRLKADQHVCHGVVVNEWTVLTAASCLMSGKEPIGIGQGSTRVSVYDNGLKRISHQIVKVGYYQQLNTGDEYTQSDLAIVKLASPFSFNESSPIRPACFNLDDNRQLKGSLSSVGLGRTVRMMHRGSSSYPEGIEDLMHSLKALQFKDVSLERKVCTNHEHLMCMESLNSEGAVCDGDEGTPLHLTNQGECLADSLFVIILTRSSNALRRLIVGRRIGQFQ